jgi:sterol desaturase/sphingolipid hydroxylase (fatty acid hydroxylase superfamily)/creatinine amidohydrolase/Fe(II)-dependent formamide hydrolase-like protein
MADELWTQIRAPLLLPFQQSERIYWVYLLAALLVACMVYVCKGARGRPRNLRNLFAFLFPRRIWLHRSSVNDYVFFYINAILQGLVLIPLFTGSGVATMLGTQSALTSLMPTAAGAIPGGHPLVIAIFTLLVATAVDFALFYTHYLQHRIPWLWEFHKVHHSAEVLNPLTLYRMHPVDNLFSLGLSSLAAGAVHGLYQFLCAGEGFVYNLLGTNAVFVVFYLAAYNLRHSHIWLDYGAFWSRIFISPAQHQLHHSKEARHWDKNMGFLFAFWDRAFGCLYVPRGRERFRIGIGEDEQRDFQNLWQLYFTPVRNVARDMRRPFQLRGRRLAAFSAVLCVTASSIALSESQPQRPAPITAPVFLEDLTWQEVRRAIDTGTTIAIIPTGGTEQNGPHMILGKHNYIVNYTAGRIAQALGNALVAPVVAYVPEGNIDPPTGHMPFAGTLSLPEAVFEGVLEFTARSLRAHGFKVICLVGDSGWNQLSQARVAEKLNREWAADAVRVLHVGDYYEANGQVAHLRNLGFDLDSIGSHAALRDTSELLALNARGIRGARLRDNRHSEFAEVGSNGNPLLASPQTGTLLLELKIAAALRQIRAQLPAEVVRANGGDTFASSGKP